MSKPFIEEFIANDSAISITRAQELLKLFYDMDAVQRYVKSKYDEYDRLIPDMPRCSCGGYALHYSEKSYGNYVEHKVRCSKQCRNAIPKEWDEFRRERQSQDHGRG